MIRGYKKLIGILVVPIFLAGCWDYRDVNKRSINLSIGIDEVNNKIEYTGEIAKLATGGPANKGQAQITDVYKFRSLGNQFEGSRIDYNSKLTYPSFLGALRVVIFSKKYAEKIGIEPYINRINFSSEFRNSELVAISEKATDELFSGKVDNDICIGYAIENTIRYLSEGGGTLYRTAQDILSDIQFKQIGYLLPYVTKEKNIVKYLGFAVMKDSKLIGIIKIQESNGFLFVLASKPSMITVISHPSNDKNLLSVKAAVKKRSIKTSYKDKKIDIDIDLKLNAEIQYEYQIEPLSKEDTKKIETIVSNMIKKDVISAINRSKNEFQCDVFNFAAYFKADNYEEYKKIKWEEDYQKAKVSVNVETTITKTNLVNPNAKKPN